MCLNISYVKADEIYNLLKIPNLEIYRLKSENNIRYLHTKGDFKIGVNDNIECNKVNQKNLTDKFSVIEKNLNEDIENLEEIEKKIVKVLDQKVRPAVAKDGGDIKFKEFKDGIVKVQLQGSCSGCSSSTKTLKQGVQNLLKHYVKEVNSVEAV